MSSENYFQEILSQFATCLTLRQALAQTETLAQFAKIRSIEEQNELELYEKERQQAASELENENRFKLYDGNLVDTKISSPLSSDEKEKENDADGEEEIAEDNTFSTPISVISTKTTQSINSNGDLYALDVKRTEAALARAKEDFRATLDNIYRIVKAKISTIDYTTDLAQDTEIEKKKETAVHRIISETIEQEKLLWLNPEYMEDAAIDGNGNNQDNLNENAKNSVSASD